MADPRACVCGDVHLLDRPCPILARVVEKFGFGARIGRNEQHPDLPLYVGKYERGEWKQIGFGKTWDEALAGVRKVKFQKGNGQFEYEEEKKETAK